MYVLYDPGTLLHRTIEMLSSHLMPALESPERILAIVDAIQSCQPTHVLLTIEFALAHTSMKETFFRRLQASHDGAYLQHLQTIHRDWVEAGIIKISDTVLPECFAMAGLAPSSSSASCSSTKQLKVLSDLHARPGLFAFDLSAGITYHTWESALASAHLAVEGARMVGPHDVWATDSGIGPPPRDVLALCRPPGHHCTTRLAGGYCYLNNAVLAVDVLRQSAVATAVERGDRRIAVLDLDFHHGNGTQSYFYADPTVLYVSIHGDGEYPYYTGGADETGEGLGEGFNLNLPLPLGATIDAYLDALRVAIAKLQSYRPLFLIVSLGFDTFEHDPLGAFKIKTEHYEAIAHEVRGAEGLRNVPALLLLEGGYVLKALGANVLSFLRGWGPEETHE
jgi:acetoin utilization deacetylase AcuC-like enzyme